jgi:tetratricopeptide (TPR) repeat protein
MPSTDHLRFFTVALILILSLFCLLLARTTFASRNLNLHRAPRSEDHSPAYKEGMNALRNSDYEKAAEQFKQAAADRPDDMWAFYYFGLCLLKLKRAGEAANAYQQAMVINPSEAAVHYQLGKIYLEKGDRAAAEKEHRWLQEFDQELALYLSDLFPSDKPTSQQTQETPPSSANDKLAYEPMTQDLRPTILYREKAKYTEIARINAVQGIVVLQAVFAFNGEMQNIRVIRGLPDGLTHKAIEAAQKIRFNPATKEGEPVSAQGSAALEFSFKLY